MKRFDLLTLPLVTACVIVGCGGGETHESSSTGAAGAGGSGSASSGSGTSSGGGASATSASSSSSGGGSGGASASSSSSGSTSSSSSSGSAAPTVCSFASGLNIAWVNFANDVPNPDVTTFQTIFQNTHAAGGRVVRWWFHTNGTVTPGYQANGMAQALPASHIAGVKSILDAAHAAGVAVNMSLWSFDMLQGSSENISAATTTNNTNFLEVDANRQAYIDNYLTPLVTALKGYPGLYSWEIFNEPEGMLPNGGWAATRVAENYIQRTVNWLASAIHTADPTALVTSGAQTFQYCSTVTGMTNDYSDAALQAAGGKANGTLDFYEVHYYESNGTQYSCFEHPASYWKLDKKLVMGEFYAATTDGVNQDNLYTNLFSNGYDGSWAWSYTEKMPYTWPSMQVPMQNLYTAQTATVGSCP